MKVSPLAEKPPQDARSNPLAEPEATGFAALRDRLQAAKGGPVSVVPAEAAPVIAADLPVRGRAQKRAALPFALEEQIATPLDDTHCALGPMAPQPARPNRHLAIALNRALIPARSSVPVYSEVLAIPAPDADDTQPAWAVWAETDRAAVRTDDGTGFAVATEMLPALWRLAGKPRLDRLAGPLSGDLPSRDLSANPPPVAPADLSFDLRQGAFAPAGSGPGRPLRFAAGIAALAILLHTGLAIADLRALRAIAETDRTRAEEALEPHLPGVDIDAIGPAHLNRLQGDGNNRGPSPFLTLLARSFAPLAAETELTIRRMGFNAADNRLTLLIEAPDLDALQRAEQALSANGLSVQSGVATARAGAAEAEFRVTGTGS